jgi:thioester reductase-like protein
VAQLLMTGFPGFLGSALLPRLLARRPGTDAVCVVQERHAVLAGSRVKELEVTHPDTTGRVRLVVGDVTASGLGISAKDRARLDDVSEVWHLAAVYDLAVPPEIAHRVNVDGTRNVLGFSRGLADLRRVQYVSTCYVSGRHEGRFDEDALEEGQVFRNHYEQTKYDAEVLVRAAMADGLPATIYRPGIVVGDSATGETQKYDGPYFLATFLQRQPSVAMVPALGDADEVRVCLVPRDFVVGAMDELSVLEESRGRTYALVDPDPPTVREVVTRFAKHLGKRVVWVPLPLTPVHALVDHVPGAETLLGLPAEALDYFASPTTYDTTNTTTHLAASGLTCPPFESYAETLLDFMQAHPEYDAHAMT